MCFEAGVMIHSGVFFARNCRYSIRNGCAARCRRQRSKGIGKFPQQAENRFRVTKALLAEEWVQKIVQNLEELSIDFVRFLE